MSGSEGFQRIHFAGALLIAATGVNWLVSGSVGRWAWLAVLAISAFKCRVVMREFMELRCAPPAWRRAFDLWLAALVLLVGGARWAALGG